MKLLILLLLLPIIGYSQKDTKKQTTVPLFSFKLSKLHARNRPDTITGIITAVRRIKSNRKDRVKVFEGYIVNGYAYDKCWNRMPMNYHVKNIK